METEKSNTGLGGLCSRQRAKGSTWVCESCIGQFTWDRNSYQELRQSVDPTIDLHSEGFIVLSFFLTLLREYNFFLLVFLQLSQTWKFTHILPARQISLSSWNTCLEALLNGFSWRKNLPEAKLLFLYFVKENIGLALQSTHLWNIHKHAPHKDLDFRVKTDRNTKHFNRSKGVNT